MNKFLKTGIFLTLMFILTMSLFGCGNKTPEKPKQNGKEAEQKKPEKQKQTTDEEIEKLFDMEKIDGGYAVKKYKGVVQQPEFPNPEDEFPGGELPDEFANSYFNDVKIPNQYKGEKVIKISNNAFEGNASLGSVEIPDTIQEIEEGAFAECSNLQAVTMKQGLKKIGDHAFYRTSITSLTMPKSVEEIGSRICDSCKKLKTVTLSEGLKNISEQAFRETAIESINIPSNVKEIGYEAFADCESLQEVTLNEGLTKIDDLAFYGSKISTLTIPKTVEEIGASAFEANMKLKTLTLNEGLKKIGNQAFRKLSIESLTIPSTVAEIGERAFAHCHKLEKIKCGIKADEKPKGWHDMWNVKEKKGNILYEVEWKS